MLPEPPHIKHPARDFGDRNGHAIQAIVLHHTAGSASLGWLSGNVNGTSIHILIEKDGTTYRLVDDDKAAYHVGFSRITLNGVVYAQEFKGRDANRPTLGIEIENLGDGKDPYPEVQLKTAAAWVAYWWSIHGKVLVVRHGDIDTRGKHDPLNVSVQDVLKYITVDTLATPPPVVSTPVPPVQAITAQSPLLSAPRSTLDQATNYLVKRGVHASYTAADVKLICGYYWTECAKVGIDPTLLVAQMIHETGGLTSWWSLRPRRNPAGIGVNGEVSRGPNPGAGWVYNTISRQWQRGFAFPDWNVAVRAHLGHILCYAFTDVDMSIAMHAMVLLDPRAPFIPASYRGVAKTLSGLNQRWASPGLRYGESIAEVAEAIRKS